MALHTYHDIVNTQLASHNEWMRMRDAVAIGLLKLNPDFLSIKTPKNPDKETMLKPANISKINA